MVTLSDNSDHIVTFENSKKISFSVILLK